MKRSYTILEGDTEHQVDIEKTESGYLLNLGKSRHSFDLLHRTQTLSSFLIDESEVLEADTKFQQDKCTLNVRNVTYHLEVFDPKRRMISQSDLAGGSGVVLAPMPGKIVEVLVKESEKVEKGQALVIIEAMKMQNELTAPMDGIVQEIQVKAGDAVEADQKLALVAAD